MDAEVAVRRLLDVVRDVEKAGYVVTGQLEMCIPRDPGRVEVKATSIVGTLSVLSLKAVAVQQQASAVQAEQPLAETYSGECCINCGGHRLQQAGVCKVCLDCGTSGGCG